MKDIAKLYEELRSIIDGGSESFTHEDAVQYLKDKLAQPEQEPVGKLQEATAERAWFTIAELNAWADKKLSENPHWVMPKDEPERDEPPPQRTWVVLTDAEIDQGLLRTNYAMQTAKAWRDGVTWAYHQLKEKNNA